MLEPVNPPKERLIRGRTLDERRQERRRDLLDMALQLFGTQGYASTTIEQLCRESYVSTRYFYEEFNGREDLLEALYTELMGVILTAGIEAETGADDENPLTRNRIAAFVHAVVDDERVARVVFVESVGVSPELEGVRRRSHAAVAIYVSDYFRRKWPANTEFHERSYWVALALVGGMIEVIVDWVADESRPDVESLIDGITWMMSLINSSFDPG
jgi:AcrR family transcriptional regulator